jgi:hypothetical protein
MVGPLGVLAEGSIAATSDGEDIDGGFPRGCWRQVRQRPPSKLELSMVGPPGVLAAGPVAATTKARDIDSEPLGGGVLVAGPAADTTEAGDINGGPPRLHGDMK